MRLSWLHSLVGAGLLLVAPSLAWAQGLQALELEVQAPGSDCVRAEPIRRSVAAMLGPAFELRATLRVRLVVQRRPSGGLRLRMELDHDGVRSRRSLVLAGCPEVREAASLLIALALDPQLSAAQVPPSGAAPPVPQPAADAASELGGRQASSEVAPQRPAAPPGRPVGPMHPAVEGPQTGSERVQLDPQDPASEPLTFSVFAPQVGLAVGLLGSVSPVLGGQLALRWGLFQVQIGGLYLPPSHADVAGSPNLRLRFEALVARPKLCGRFVALGAWSLSGCAGVWLGQLSIGSEPAGEGDDTPTDALLTVLEVEVDLALSLSPSVQLHAAPGLIWALRPPEVRLRSGQLAHRVGEVGLLLGVSAEFLF